MPARKSLIGLRFGKLKVIGDAPDRFKKGVRIRVVVCRCECGIEKEVYPHNLKSGCTVSCGCHARQKTSERSLRHGMTDSRIWIIWKDMLDRCRNPNFPWFHNYGGRGIKVCERWLTFENFAEDMGIGKKGWTLDRINNNGNYAPDNCCWATAKHQGRNKRNNRLVTVDGLTACLAEMAERFHINPETVSRRIRSGWPLDEAFKTPSQRANH